MKRAQGVIILLIFIMTALTMLKLYLLIDLAVDAHIYVQLITETAELRKEHLELEDELLYYSSYQYLLEETKRQGYIQATYYQMK